MRNGPPCETRRHPGGGMPRNRSSTRHRPKHILSRQLPSRWDADTMLGKRVATIRQRRGAPGVSYYLGLSTSWPMIPPTAAPPTVPNALPPVSAAPPTPPIAEPIAVFSSCLDIPLQAPRLPALEIIATTFTSALMMSLSCLIVKFGRRGCATLACILFTRALGRYQRAPVFLVSGPPRRCVGGFLHLSGFAAKRESCFSLLRSCTKILMTSQKPPAAAARKSSMAKPG